MPNIKTLKASIAATLLLAGPVSASSPAARDLYAVPSELQVKIDSHPHVRRLTNWGSRPDWSADSKRLLYVTKEYGDLLELDVTSGRTTPLSFHFPHVGIFRAYYLANGDILLTAPRTHQTGFERITRFYESELWLLRTKEAGPAIPLNEPNFEGVAVSRDNMRIVWARGTQKTPDKVASAEAAVKLPGSNQLWTGDVVADGAAPGVIHKRLLIDCGAPTGAFAKMLQDMASKCVAFEPQNFLPGNSDRATFTMVTIDAKGVAQMGGYIVDLPNGDVTPVAMKSGPAYAEFEGVFADGKSTLVEYTPLKGDLSKSAEAVDLWQLALDGSGRLNPVTHYHAIDPELKSNQGVVSPDGRWMAFSVSTATVEKQVPGQGIGIFLMDLKKAGF